MNFFSIFSKYLPSSKMNLIFKNSKIYFLDEKNSDKMLKISFLKLLCLENDIFIKALITGKKIGIIDSKMKILSDALLKRQTAEELLTKKYNVRWVNDLREILDLINEFTKQTYKPQTDFDEYEIDMHDNKKYDILEIGTKVRTALFSPVDIVKDKRLLFNFRSGDVR